MRAVILAGGLGTRLRPYTTILPKPLVPVGDRPILEHILRQLAAAGVDHIDLCVSHLGELIQVYFSQSKALPGGARARLALGGRAARDGGRAARRARPRRDVHRDERRRADDARLRAPWSTFTTERPAPRSRSPTHAKRVAHRPRRDRSRRDGLRDRLPREAERWPTTSAWASTSTRRGARPPPPRGSVQVPRAGAAAPRGRRAGGGVPERRRLVRHRHPDEYERAVAGRPGPAGCVPASVTAGQRRRARGALTAALVQRALQRLEHAHDTQAGLRRRRPACVPSRIASTKCAHSVRSGSSFDSRGLQMSPERVMYSP